MSPTFPRSGLKIRSTSEVEGVVCDRRDELYGQSKKPWYVLSFSHLTSFSLRHLSFPPTLARLGCDLTSSCIVQSASVNCSISRCLRSSFLYLRFPVPFSFSSTLSLLLFTFISRLQLPSSHIQLTKFSAGDNTFEKLSTSGTEPRVVPCSTRNKCLVITIFNNYTRRSSRL